MLACEEASAYCDKDLEMAATSSDKGCSSSTLGDKGCSSSSTLGEAVLSGCLPTLVRLEEGFCGPDEATSMSLGDVLALQSCVIVNNHQVVIAYYKSDMNIKDESDDSEEVETYRALIALRLDNADIANLRITMFPDPGGMTFARYVTGLFADCNWIGREKELFVSMAPVRKDKKSPSSSLVQHQPYGLRMFDSPTLANTSRDQILTREASAETSRTAEKTRWSKLLTVAATVTRRRGGLPPSPAGEAAATFPFKSEPMVPSQPSRKSQTEVRPPNSRKNLLSRLSSFLSKNDAKYNKHENEDRVNSDGEYDEIDETRMEAYQHDYCRLGKVEVEQNSPPGVQDTTGRVGVLPGNKSARSLIPDVQGRYTDLPDIPGTPPHTSSTPVAQMSVRELCARLEECCMPDLADVCCRQAIDGRLLCSLSEDVLLAQPFQLTQYLLEKWRCVKTAGDPSLSDGSICETIDHQCLATVTIVTATVVG